MSTNDLGAPIPPPYSHLLLAAQGWMELGDDSSAWEELNQLPEGYHWHPDAVELRWHLNSRKGDWEECLKLSQQLVDLAPERINGWIHRSFALHELGRTEEAFDKLVPVIERFPKVWTIPYNLGCYCAQMNRLEEARQWVRLAMELDRDSTLAAATADQDLEPIQEWLVAMQVQSND